ncbi:MAG TPA: MOSC N-terminal beta barrel domain-containing protein [Ilumatobacteraceae bacterium]|nr:MOSC N-terminal beta barrel domain-containing protein [Ilumatobacteraceae bacterium]
MHVSQLWRYPVKSMVGGRAESIELDQLGIVGDRTWATRDLERGGIRGAKKIGSLMRLAARDTGDDHVEITLPDGSTVRTTDPDVDERVSAAVDHPVVLERLRPAGDLDHYRRGAPDTEDFVAELRGIFGREEDEPFPDFSVFPPIIAEFESPPGTYYDAFPLLVMTEAALAALAGALPASNVDVRRFRPSLVVDTGDTGSDASTPGHPEFDWTGRRATLGSATVEFAAPCPRCVMVTREIDDAISADRAVLRHIVRDLDQNLGVYATVVAPGVVRLGDQLSFV